ncbi:riboflavin synthase alpha chain [Thermovibrio guaymasensis]|uniref:Riboflavin synthase n=1 Tax=Thermovibrio guaymasensis TaxID=240167 RepID=A0A420W808_9BACT|nr:riboflavin synthase [Thermovibrio guaymasensis]RKQ63418.1 riboflavin synthase alpha chain [Thermovibrio guaymasensis]
MFTGIVEEVGKVKGIKKGSKSSKLTIECRVVLEGTRVGDSIAVNGVCLTVVEIGRELLTFDVSYETLKRTTLSLLKPGENVNLERALRLGDRLGGHILQGHVDTTTKVTSIKREGEGYRFSFKLPKEYSHLVVEKGSIGIDGISLTVAELLPDSFSVAVIPHTFENTNLKFKRSGSLVNLEFDIIGKYVEKMVKSAQKGA